MAFEIEFLETILASQIECLETVLVPWNQELSINTHNLVKLCLGAESHSLFSCLSLKSVSRGSKALFHDFVDSLPSHVKVSLLPISICAA